jgi:hypothetical protein
MCEAESTLVGYIFLVLIAVHRGSGKFSVSKERKCAIGPLSRSVNMNDERLYERATWKYAKYLRLVGKASRFCPGKATMPGGGGLHRELSFNYITQVGCRNLRELAIGATELWHPSSK